MRVQYLCAALAWLASTACSGNRVEAKSQPYAALQTPHELAEGDTGKPSLEQRRQSRGAEAPDWEAAEADPPAPDLPDPEPLVTQAQYEYIIRYDHGVVSVDSVRLRRLDRPVASARRMGRFAFELWIGRELIERVRFDFPLLGAAPAPGELEPGQPNLAAGANVTQTVRIPRSERATRARILDRATGKEIVVPWPPNASTDANSSDSAPGE